MFKTICVYYKNTIIQDRLTYGLHRYIYVRYARYQLFLEVGTKYNMIQMYYIFRIKNEITGTKKVKQNINDVLYNLNKLQDQYNYQLLILYI